MTRAVTGAVIGVMIEVVIGVVAEAQNKIKQDKGGKKKTQAPPPPQATSARPSAEKGAQGRNWEGVWQEQGGRRAQKDPVTQPPRTPQKPSPRAWHLHSPARRRTTRAEAGRP